MVYTAFLEHEPGREYGVFFPDLPGCVTGGETMEDALRRAPQVLKLHIEGLLADGDQLPEPTPFDQLATDRQFQDLIPFVVDAPVEKCRTLRLNISLDARLVEEIDQAARELGKTRSGFLADAAREALKHPA